METLSTQPQIFTPNVGSTGSHSNVILVCDKIEEINGKINLSGLFDTVYAEGFPALREELAIFTRVEISPGEHVERVEIRVGSEMIHDIKEEYSTPDGIKRHQSFHRIRNFVFEKTGRYDIKLFLDSKPVASTYFIVRKAL